MMEIDNLIEEPDKPYNIRHRSFFFATDVIGFVKDAQYERVFYSLFDQLVRSATSIGANLVEGKAGSTKKDWKNYYSIALKEADEISKIIATIVVNAEG